MLPALPTGKQWVHGLKLQRFHKQWFFDLARVDWVYNRYRSLISHFFCIPSSKLPRICIVIAPYIAPFYPSQFCLPESKQMLCASSVCSSSSRSVTSRCTALEPSSTALVTAMVIPRSNQLGLNPHISHKFQHLCQWNILKFNEWGVALTQRDIVAETGKRSR